MQFSQISEFDKPLHGLSTSNTPYTNSIITELLDKYPKNCLSKFSPLRLLRLAIMKFEARERLQLGPEPIEPPPKIDGELLVGLSIAAAKTKYPGIHICPCEIDGVGQIILYIYCPTRYLVEIKNNKISKYIRNA
jgi:hypothetical protein